MREVGTAASSAQPPSSASPTTRVPARGAVGRRRCFDHAGDVPAGDRALLAEREAADLAAVERDGADLDQRLVRARLRSGASLRETPDGAERSATSARISRWGAR